ncbi:MAG: CBU_0585 family protein [Gammaproteobacteria bacterium]
MSNLKDKKVYKSGYISEIDKFFHEFDRNRIEFPESRKQEVRKYQAIFNRRDYAIEVEPVQGWEKF